MVKEVNKEHKNVEMTRKKKRSGIGAVSRLYYPD